MFQYRSAQPRPMLQPIVWRSLYVYWIVALLRQRKNIFSANFDLMIDGYQRSANTFAVRAFEVCQSEGVRVNSHNHNPPAIIAAIKMGKPVILLIRNPEDAIASWTIRSRFPLRYTINSYVRFYEILEPHIDRVCIATFDEVARNFTGVIDRLNARYDLSFKLKTVDAETTTQIFSRIENAFRRGDDKSMLDEMMVSRPSADRQQIKSFIVKEMARREHAFAMMKAKHIYNKIYALRASDPFADKANGGDARSRSLAIK